MATKESKSEAAATGAELLEDIDVLRLRQGVSRPVFAGLCAANGWKPGRQMTGSDFAAADKVYQKAPMGGRKGGVGRVHS